MRSTFFKLLPALALLSGPCTLFSANAEDDTSKITKVMEINVESSIDPVTAVGLFISESGTKQLNVKEITKTENGQIIVAIPYRESDIPTDSMASALVLGQNGEIAFGNLRPVFSPEPKESFLNIPACAPEKITKSGLEAQISSFETLIQMRLERRKIAQEAIKNALSGDFLARLQSIESRFGFNYDYPLSPNLAPVALVDRLTRVIESLRSLEMAKQAAPTPLPQALKDSD